MKAYNPTIYRD